MPRPVPNSNAPRHLPRMPASETCCWAEQLPARTSSNLKPNVQLSRPVLHIRRSRLLGAMRATEIASIDFHPVPDDLALAVLALGSERVDGALEAVKNVPLARRDHFECFVVVVPADF